MFLGGETHPGRQSKCSKMLTMNVLQMKGTILFFKLSHRLKKKSFKFFWEKMQHIQLYIQPEPKIRKKEDQRNNLSDLQLVKVFIDTISET